VTDADYMRLMRADVVPVGAHGLWTIDRFDLAAPLDMRGVVAPAGRYTSLRRLEEATDGPGDCGLVWRTWMSDVPAETETALPFLHVAHGDVLVTGLGLGTILRALVEKPEVRLVTVVELNPAVLALVGPTYADHPKIQLVPGDALTVDLGETFDCAWHDIWPTICAKNLPEMFKLRDRFFVRGRVMFWAIDQCLAQVADAEGKRKLPRGTRSKIERMIVCR
jgi:hypothetical protein